MRIVVLGGAGIIGRLIAGDLAQDVAEVVIADLDARAAEDIAGQFGANVRALGVDVRDAESLDGALAGMDVCINSVQYYFNLDVMKSCKRMGVPYLDLGGLFHTTREQLKLANSFRDAGITAILGLGSCPGVANVQAQYLAAQLESVEAVRIYNGSTIAQGESLSWAYSVETILDEISQPAVIYQNGEFVELPALSGEEFYLFPDPIGYAKTHLSLHSEVATIPLSFASKGIQECFFKITFFGYSETVLRKFQFLAELGLSSREKIEVDGVQVAPRSVLLKLLRRSPTAQAPQKSEGFKDIATEVQGEADGKRVNLRMDTSAWPHPESDITGGKLLVASPPAIVARWLADGSLNRPGVWPPEQIVDPDRFFTELEMRGAENQITRVTQFSAT